MMPGIKAGSTGEPMDIIGASYRTTIIGYLGAAATAIIPVLQGERIMVRNLVLAVIIALLGRFAKDSNRSGRGE